MCLAEEDHPTCWDDPKVKAKYQADEHAEDQLHESEAIYVGEHVGEATHANGEKDAHANADGEKVEHADEEGEGHRRRRLRRWVENLDSVEDAGAATRVSGRALMGGAGDDMGGGVQRSYRRQQRRLQADAGGQGDDGDDCTPLVSSDTLHQVWWGGFNGVWVALKPCVFESVPLWYIVQRIYILGGVVAALDFVSSFFLFARTRVHGHQICCHHYQLLTNQSSRYPTYRLIDGSSVVEFFSQLHECWCTIQCLLF